MKWNKKRKKYQHSVSSLKAIPTLTISDLNKEMQVEVDTSDYAMGGVLSTKCKDRK